MKREYIVGTFLITSVVLLTAFGAFFDEVQVQDFIYRYIVVWLFIAISIGQFSMKFPKRF